MWKLITERTTEQSICEHQDGTVSVHAGVGPMPPPFVPAEGAEYTCEATGRHYRWEA